MSSSNKYWMKLPAKDLAQKLESYHGRYFSSSFNPIWQTWQKNSYAYYSAVLESQSWFSSLSYKGEQGELVEMRVPQARSFIRQLLTLITKQKLAFNAIAQTTDREVVEEMRIANALMEHIVKEQQLDLLGEKMVEAGLVLGSSFIKTCWRTDQGEAYAEDPDSGAILYTGDLEISIPHITDMLYDFTVDQWDHLDWVEVRVRRNRWNLIAQHPNLEREILSLPSVVDQKTVQDYFGFEENDFIYVYEVFHKPTPSMPQGRMMFYSDHQTVYFDGENQYGCIPVEQYKPEPIMGMGFGYPMISSLLPAQEMYDHEFSATATNHAAFGVQNITVARGADLQAQELLGMNLLSYTPQSVPGGGKPEALQLTMDSPQSPKFREELLSVMGQMSNINSAVRGEVGSNMAGVAIATLTTNALEFLNSYTKSYQITLEKTMYHSVNSYRRFAKLPRLVRLTGKNNQALSKEFTGSMLEPIEGVKIQSTNPLMQTMAGRLDIAEKLSGSGLIKTVQEYVAVLDGEPLTMLIQNDLSESDLKEQENQDFLEGKPVYALALDDHAGHIQKHKSLLNDTSVRRNSDMVKSILDHIEQHNQLFKTTDPALQAMANTGKPPQGGPIPPEMSEASAPPPPPGGGMGGDLQDVAPAPEPAVPAEDLLGRA